MLFIANTEIFAIKWNILTNFRYYGIIIANRGWGDKMIEKGNLSQIKKDIETCIGERVQLISNGGRKKSLVKEGVLEKSYPSIFIVKFDNDSEAARRVSYSYTDVLTKAVQLVIYKEDQKIQVS